MSHVILETVPDLVLGLIETPLVADAISYRLTEGYDERTARVMAIAGALSAALATEPALAGDMDADAVSNLLQSALDTQTTLETTQRENPNGENLKKLNAIEFVVECLQTVFNSLCDEPDDLGSASSH